MPKPRYKHIVLKDKADETSINLRNALETLQEVLNIKTKSDLFEGFDMDKQSWYRMHLSQSKAFKQEVNKIISNQLKGIKKDLKSGLNDVYISVKDQKLIEKQLDEYGQKIGQQFLGIRTAWLNNVKALKPSQEGVERINTLHQEIQYVFDKNPTINKLRMPMKDRNGQLRRTADGSIMYEKYESYIERAVRTEIHKDIANDLVKVGGSLNMVFYIASSFGDSRKEHADLQGQIYYDSRWETFDIDESIKDQIRDYISSNNMMTIQEVQDVDKYGLGTWCNCRHTFTWVDIESVLNVKDEKELNDLRESMNMNFNGKYEEAKNKALNKQRYIERGIKDWKNARDEAQLNYDTLPQNVTTEEKQKALAQLNYAKHKVKEWQKKQREHISENDNLRRDYKRENPNDVYDLGVKK